MSDVQFQEMENEYLERRIDFLPWLPKSLMDEARQAAYQRILIKHAGAQIGKGCYISPRAHIFTDRLIIGDGTMIAAGAIVRGVVTIGTNSTINSYTHVAGRVTIGNDVRIAGHVALYGFNHGFSRTDKPIHWQPHTSVGINIGDGSWLGTHAAVVDGVHIGAHCVVAAGSIVTKSCGDFLIIGGNPARTLRDRQKGSGS